MLFYKNAFGACKHKSFVNAFVKLYEAYEQKRSPIRNSCHTKLCCLFLELNLIIYKLLFSNCICMTCQYVPCALLSYQALSHPPCFKCFQVVMMALWIDSTSSDMVPMQTYGMSESARCPRFQLLLYLFSFLKDSKMCSFGQALM